MTIKRYLSDSSLTGTSMLTAVVGGERPYVRMRESLFHPQGGGQRGDRGRIAHVRVLDTRHGENGEVDHFVDSIKGIGVGESVSFEVDRDHRHRGALLHTGGHLIAEAGRIACPKLKAVAGHHWDGEARVEFDGVEAVDNNFKSNLQSTLAELITQNLPVTVVGNPYTCRAICIGSFDPVPCGGTHLLSTSELASLAITGVKMKSGKVRVSYRV
jgi:alanyl-tRNA synthetase